MRLSPRLKHGTNYESKAIHDLASSHLSESGFLKLKEFKIFLAQVETI